LIGAFAYVGGGGCGVGHNNVEKHLE